MQKRIVHTAVLVIVTACVSIACSAGSARTPEKAPAPEGRNVEATAVVKEIYELAIARRCSAIPPKLTAEFRSAVGSTDEELEALCDSLTDSRKISSVDIRGASIAQGKGTVRVALTHRDGRVEEKDERVMLESGTWLMDS